MLKVSGFYDNSCTNGEGWRSVIFFSGCLHRCKGCQNPETWDYNFGDDFPVETLVQKVLYNLPIIDGVTLTGGEPFQEKHIYEVCQLVDRIKAENLDVWCYTGYEFEYLLEHPLFSQLLGKIDVLIDGKFVQEKFDPSLRFRGSSNQRIINVPKSLTSKEVVFMYNSILETA